MQFRQRFRHRTAAGRIIKKGNILLRESSSGLSEHELDNGPSRGTDIQAVQNEIEGRAVVDPEPRTMPLSQFSAEDLLQLGIVPSNSVGANSAHNWVIA